MNLIEAREILEKALDLDIPLMLWGPPGVGKSTLVAETAGKRKLPVCDLRLAQLDATDLRGLPVPDHDSKQLVWYPPAFLPREGEGVLFLDEIDKAPALVKNAALQLVLDRRVGDYQLPPGWRVAAAGNREEDDALSSTLGSALANRMLHVEVDPDMDTWAAWAKENDISEDIIAFLRFRPELLCKNTGEHAFPSPRSWAAASRLYKGKEPASEKTRLISSAVGGGTASEFSGWSRIYRAIEVKKILAGILPTLLKDEASLRYAVVLAVAAHISRHKIEDCAIPHLAALLDAVTPELRVLLFKSLPPDLVSQLAAHPALRKVASKMVMAYVK
jgi:hypothetical protein